MQEQGLRRYRCTRLTTIPGRYHIPETLKCHFSPAYLHKGTYHGSHHITQKTVSGNRENPHVTRLIPSRLPHIANVGPGIRMQLGKRCEIIDLQEHCRSLVHDAIVKLSRHHPAVWIQERGLARANIVFICPGYGIEARMGIRMYRYQVI